MTEMYRKIRSAVCTIAIFIRTGVAIPVIDFWAFPLVLTGFVPVSIRGSPPFNRIVYRLVLIWRIGCRLYSFHVDRRACSGTTTKTSTSAVSRGLEMFTLQSCIEIFEMFYVIKMQHGNYPGRTGTGSVVLLRRIPAIFQIVRARGCVSKEKQNKSVWPDSRQCGASDRSETNSATMCTQRWPGNRRWRLVIYFTKSHEGIWTLSTHIFRPIIRIPVYTYFIRITANTVMYRYLFSS